MGLLLTFIGLQTSKIVVPDAETMVSTRCMHQLQLLISCTGAVGLYCKACTQP